MGRWFVFAGPGLPTYHSQHRKGEHGVGFWEGWHCAFGQASVYDIVSWADGIALIKNDAQVSIQFRLFHFRALRVYALLLWFSISSRYPGGDNFIPAEWRGGVWLAWFGAGRSAVQGSSQEGTSATSAGYRHRIAVSAVRDGKLGANRKRRPAVGRVCPACPWHKETLANTLPCNLSSVHSALFLQIQQKQRRRQQQQQAGDKAGYAHSRVACMACMTLHGAAGQIDARKETRTTYLVALHTGIDQSSFILLPVCLSVPLFPPSHKPQRHACNTHSTHTP